MLPADNGETLTAMNAFLTDLLSRRNSRKGGFNNIRAVELNGGSIIEPTAFEPDPNTYRGEYYYNANTNVLYKKIKKTRKDKSIVAFWQRISQ